MSRGLCWILVGALSLCGCPKKNTPPETAAVQPPAPPAESNAPTPPANAEHPILVTTRKFVNAVAAGNYQQALSVCLPGEITEQGLKGLHAAFQWDQATFAQAWLGVQQSAVITSFVPAKGSPVSAAWAINLIVTEDGRWLIRLVDMLSSTQMVENYVAALREVAPDAKSIGL
jgi:hypothetical protein